MASLEQRGRRFRIAFRVGGEKHHISVNTTDRRDADACRTRLEENLRLVERGRLLVPEGAGVGLFLLSDGKLEKRVAVSRTLTVGELITRYRTTFTAGVKEKTTTRTEVIHLAHAEQIFGTHTPVTHVTNASLQEYINTRSGTKLRGQAIKPQTIKKEGDSRLSRPARRRA